jgi:hypothetical protein
MLILKIILADIKFMKIANAHIYFLLDQMFQMFNT